MTTRVTKAKYLLLAGLFVLATYNISRTTYEIYRSSQRLDTLKAEVEAARADNEDLKKKHEFVQTEEFLIQEARNKLNMIKPGEKVLIPAGYESEKEIEVLGSRDNKPIGYGLPGNAGRWLALFFDNN